MEEKEELEYILNGLPPEVIENFQANDIKLQHLPSITDELLKELCPKVGIRIELRNRINEYLTSKTNTVTATTSSTLNQYDENDDVILEDINDVISSNLFCPRPELPDFHLKTLLSTSPCGNSILNYYASHSTLTNRHRNQLTDIIVRHLFTRLVNQPCSKITSDEYNIITSKIISLFPKENSGIYYVPPVKKRESISGKPLFSKGKLVDKIRNTLYKSGEKRKISPDENENSVKKKRLSELQDKNTDKIHFLQNNNEPWSQILEYWQDTFIIRKDTEYKNISEFIEGWRILNDPRSEVLINLDFNMMYPNSSNKIFNNWEIFINRIISIKFPKQCDDVLAALNEKIQNEQNQDDKIPNQIKLLCYLIPPRGRLNKRTKFSTLECLENFIIDVEKPGDLHFKMDEAKQKALRLKQNVQPYLLSCGSESSEKNYYLVIDDIKYKFTSPAKAFDTLFKSYHTFNATYPAAAEHLYLLIQNCVYDIQTKFDKTFPYIADVMAVAKV